MKPVGRFIACIGDEFVKLEILLVVDFRLSPGPQGLDGVDLSPALSGLAAAPDRPIVCDNLNPRWGPGTEFRMVRQGPYKYVRFRDSDPLFFDLSNDLGEQHNLAEQRPDVVERLRNRLTEYLTAVDAQLPRVR